MAHSAMNPDEPVAILGVGAMGTALLVGLLRHSPVARFHLHVNTNQSLLRIQNKLAPLGDSARSRIATTSVGPEGLVRAANSAPIVILACPPKELSTVTSLPGLVEALRGKLFISLLAGVSLDMIRHTLAVAAGRDHRLCGTIRTARVIPTLGAAMGQSVSMIALDEDDRSSARVDALFSTVGTIIHLPEVHMNRATALGAVCHALTLIATDTAGDASAAEGLPRPLAKELAAKCFMSCGSLLDQGMTPEELKDAMAVPQGITINAVLDLEKASRANIAGAVRSAIQYAEKMA